MSEAELEKLRETWRECIRSYINWFLGQNYSKVQAQNRAYTLSRFARIMIKSGLAPGDVTFKVAVKFLEFERARKRPNALKWEFDVLKSFYKYLVKAGYVKENPFQDIRIRTSESPIRSLSDEELEKLFRAADEIDPVKADALRFIAYTGLRLEEFLILTSRDIDLERGEMRVFNVKTDKYEKIPLLREAIEVLKRRSIDELNQFSKRTYERFIRKAAMRAGIQGKVTIHTLRHTFVTMVLKRTKDPLLTKFMARHVSLATTSRYVHQELEDAKKKLEDLRLLIGEK